MLKVQDSKYIISAVHEDGYPDHNGQEITLLGRSNVGKSTFINRFCNRRKLAYTSAKPGKTQTLNFFYINDDLYFVDVPGYGYAKVSKVQREEFGRMIEEYLTTRIKLAFAILLIDFKVGPTEDDILMYKFLKFYHKDVLVIATKKDKVKNSMQHKQMIMIKDKMEMDENDEFYAYTANSDKDVVKLHEIIEKKLGV
jgi:GTP-binding protein